MSRAREEDGIQKTVADTLDALGVLWCHVPNGGKRSPIEAAIMKGLGVKPGVPDIMIFDPPPIAEVCHACGNTKERGTFIELKSKDGVLSPDQSDWIQELLKRRWVGGIGRGVDDTLAKLKELGYI